MGSGTRVNQADKYVEHIEDIRSIAEVAEANALIQREALLEFKKLRNNMVMAVPVQLFANSGLLLNASGVKFTRKEEPVYKVVMVGTRTDDYLMDVSVGDYIMITNAAGYIHEGTTRAKVEGGPVLPYYYIIALSDVLLVVNYALLPKPATLPDLKIKS